MELLDYKQENSVLKERKKELLTKLGMTNEIEELESKHDVKLFAILSN